ncbi:HAMP domain-containing sensor histidine kinase [uncultured Clostridium sp.]|uniref:sensor histidine kinase n=1 Tax=uncultured Clostridium sp. TaxID=59620 RepID=UPI002601EF38|nr:HAMP domain-containing sensor histidine kinase [uncultured Clostridium sp.]
MGVRKRENTLYLIFLKYLIKLVLLLLILFGILGTILWRSFETGFILPANYAQNEVLKLQNKSFENIEFNEDIIPYPCGFLFFYNDGKVNGSVQGKIKDNAILYKEGKYIQKQRLFGGEQYAKLNFKNGECVVAYGIEVKFGNPKLNKFINPNIIGNILIIAIIIGSTLFIAIRFGKMLKREMYPLLDATEKIKNKDLEFEILKGKVKEFNNILDSVDDMKIALKKSLKEQWILEKEKEDGINALAHDIKTPLTIIKGNSELLLESDLNTEDIETIEHILKNSNKIERYMERLMEISKSEKEIDFKKEFISKEEFLKEIENEIKMICIRKNIEYKIDDNIKEKEIYGNKDCLIRAILNVVANGVDYSKENSEISLNIEEEDENIIFTIRDSGKGFMVEEIKNATNKFFMGRKEREVGKHHGLGLYIVDSIAKKHDGYVIIKNREDKKGGEIKIVIKKFKI